ncbi:MAG: quinone-dependent dihydroorotate dehydrogenase [Bacteroidetes bacterium]|nr:quinone-dependent dihydroorotate dehydrogenase [Bacteroidota bacterium]
MYHLLRRFFFLFDAEAIHYFAMRSLQIICRLGFRGIIAARCTPRHAGLAREVWGLHFRNPIGLAAGFDKNALYLDELEALGFGFVEIGTVTPLPQAGNDKPRLFRLPKDKALINRMGFNNDGVKVVAERLRKRREKQLRKEALAAHVASGNRSNRLLIGGNIGKNKVTPNEDAWKDYETCFRELYDCVDYFVVNVSSPNTPGLRELQEKDSLRKILSHLQTINQQLMRGEPRPILLKIAPDLEKEQINDVIDLALEIQLDGLVAANTTISRASLQTPAEEIAAIGAGGLSGLPVQKRATEIVSYIHGKTEGNLPVIASGGIFTADDAREKLAAGGTLIQVWTGFIYEGPAIAKKIASGL